MQVLDGGLFAPAIGLLCDAKLLAAFLEMMSSGFMTISRHEHTSGTCWLSMAFRGRPRLRGPGVDLASVIATGIRRDVGCETIKENDVQVQYNEYLTPFHEDEVVDGRLFIIAGDSVC